MKHKHEHITAHDRMVDRHNLEHGRAAHHSGHKHHPMSEHHGHMHEHLEHEHERHARYMHEMDKPGVPPHGHQEHGMGVSDFKGEAQDIAYGQASMQGMKADSKRMSAQFKDYHWDSDTGGASGY